MNDRGSDEPVAVGDDVWLLLQATIARYVSPTGRIVRVDPLPIGSGMSGATLRRYRVTVEPGIAGGSPRTVRLVTKDASSIERRAIAWLNAQRHPNVPFGHALAPPSADTAPICLQDAGDSHRPNSLAPVPADLVRRESAALAGIHAANLGRSHELAWLPSADHGYFERMIERDAFRPAWTAALADNAFVEQFGPAIERVEARAARIVGEMARLNDERDALTLVHTDINPSNVLVQDGIPFIIDWQAAHYGSFYLDLPHHFCTLDQAEPYRLALGRLGVAVEARRFAERYRAAAAYTGLRYLWWTLDAWREDRSMAAWVWHYVGMIEGGA